MGGTPKARPFGADEATLVREVRRDIEAKRTPREELETVNFQRLDTENDWTDL